MTRLDTVLAVSGEAKKAGPIGLAVILLLCIACYFLFKSMSKHMRRVRENFPAEPLPPSPVRQPAAGGTAAAPAAGLPRAQVIPPAERERPPAVEPPPKDDPPA